MILLVLFYLDPTSDTIDNDILMGQLRDRHEVFDIALYSRLKSSIGHYE